MNRLPRSIPLNTDAAGTAPPDAFGSFRVLHQIGAGTLGPVFRAYDQEHDRLVAIKLFALDLPPDRSHRLVAELDRLVTAELTHVGLAAPLAAGLADTQAYLAQELVTAESLDIALREYGPAPVGDAVRVATELAGALDFAAVVNVEHGALHPRDVLISQTETRISGIGIARALERIGVTPPVRRPYTAPERIAGEPWDRRADVFSLAALTFEMLWGRRVAGVGADAAAAVTDLAGGDRAALQVLFARALAERPDDRFATALEFAAALKQAFRELAAAEPTRTAVPAAEREPRLPLETAGPDDLELRAAETARYHDVEVGPSAAAPLAPAVEAPLVAAPPPVEQVHLRAPETKRAEPAIVEPPMAELPIVERAIAEPSIVERPLARPAPVPPPRGERQRRGSPIGLAALTLVLGLAIGFAGGYMTGTRETSPARVAVAPAAVTPAAKTPQAAVARPASVEGRDAAARGSTARAETPAPAPAPNVSTARSSGTAPPVAQTRRPVPADAVTGRVLIRSTPAGAVAFVDGEQRGLTPVAVRDLASGPHRIRVERLGYVPEERRIVITRADPALSLTIPLSRVSVSRLPTPSTPATMGAFQGALDVESRPQGAKVYVDGRLVGTTPVVLTAMSAGEHVVRLERDGYRRWSSSVRVVAGDRNKVTASLEK